MRSSNIEILSKHSLSQYLWSTKLSLHILKFDASMSCESNEHPADLCMILMLFLLCPYSSYTDLESGSSRSSMPVEQSVVWMWDISRGTVGIIPGLYVTVAHKQSLQPYKATKYPCLQTYVMKPPTWYHRESIFQELCNTKQDEYNVLKPQQALSPIFIVYQASQVTSSTIHIILPT